MTDFMELLKTRRSIRKYENKEVPQKMIDTVLESVQWSQSWANTQCWEIIVVKEASRKEKLQQTILPKNPATKAIVDAPVVLALCGKMKSSGYYNDIVTTKFGDWLLFDLGIATQSLCLCAHSLGLGTVVVGLFDHAKAKEALAVPDGYELVVLIPMGYPAKSPSSPKRKELTEFTHYETF